jgi:hypothetical protein
MAVGTCLTSLPLLALARAVIPVVGQHERGFILTAEIAGELERGMALGTVHEDGDGHQVVPHRELAAGEDRAGQSALTPSHVTLN